MQIPWETQGKHSRAQFRSSVANRSAIREMTTHVVAFLEPLTEAINPRQNEAEGHYQSSFLDIHLLSLGALEMCPDLIQVACIMLMP